MVDGLDLETEDQQMVGGLDLETKHQLMVGGLETDRFYLSTVPV